MGHLALYRQFRPKNFDEVIGQDAIINTLKNQVTTGEIGHAYLFTGSRGTGKTSCAKIFAKAINCLHPVNGSPCYECENCKADDGLNMDIVEIDAASNNSVEDIRDIVNNLKFLPTNGKYKVYIIDEVHMLSINAFNALLKSIEEPPEHVVFILATTEVHKIPKTILSRVIRFDFKLVSVEILSRVIRFDFKLVSVEELTKLLKKVFVASGIKAEDEAVVAIARSGEGSVRDALSIAEGVSAYAYKDITYLDVQSSLGISDSDSLIKITDYMYEGSLGKLFELTNNLYTSGKNMAVFAKDLTLHFRNLLIINTTDEANDILHLPDEEFEKLKSQAQKIDNAHLLFYLKKYSDIEADLRYSISPRMLIEMTALECIRELDGKLQVSP